MSGFTRIINGRNIHFPNLFTSEVRALNELFDEYDRLMERVNDLNQKLCHELAERKSEINRLTDLLQADLLAKELKESLDRREPEVRRGWFRGLLGEK